MRIRETRESLHRSQRGRLDFSELRLARRRAGAQPAAPVRGAATRYLLGYDLDPTAVASVLAEQRQLCLRARSRRRRPAAGRGATARPLRRRRRASGRDPTRRPASCETSRSPQEHLLSFLQSLDADRAGLPDAFRAQLLSSARAATACTPRPRLPELEEAVVWMFRSFAARRRAGAGRDRDPGTAPARHRRACQCGPAGAARVAGPAGRRHQARYPAVADLAATCASATSTSRSSSAPRAQVYAEMERAPRRPTPIRTAATGTRTDRAARVAARSRCAAMLLHRWVGAPRRLPRGAARGVLAAGYYRIRRALRDMRFVERRRATRCATADYDSADKRCISWSPYARSTSSPTSSQRVAAAPGRGATPTRRSSCDLVRLAIRRATRRPTRSAAELRRLLGRCDFGRPLQRVDVTVTSEPAPTAGAVSERTTSRSAMQRRRLRRGRALPQPAPDDRASGWTCGGWPNFALERLPSAEDVYLFHGVAHDNPKDERLFALAEVRDLTPVRDDGRSRRRPAGSSGWGWRRWPRSARLHVRTTARAAASVGTASCSTSGRRSTLPGGDWRDLARPLAPLPAALGLEKVVLRVAHPRRHGEQPRATAVRRARRPERRRDPVRERAARRPGPAARRVPRRRCCGPQRVGGPYPVRDRADARARAWCRVGLPAGTIRRARPRRRTASSCRSTGPRPATPPASSSGVHAPATPTKIPEGMTRVRAARRPDPRPGLARRARVPADHRRPRPRRAAAACRSSGSRCRRGRRSPWTAAPRTWTGSRACCAGSSSSPRPAARSTSSSPASTSAPSRTGTPRRRCSCTPGASSS